MDDNKYNVKLDLTLPKQRRNVFDYTKYIKYCNIENISKCLIRNCPKDLKGRIAGNIKRHYDHVHNLIINYQRLHDNDSLDKEDDEEQADFMKRILRKYYNYDVILNKSFCKFKSCNEIINDKESTKLINHYSQQHNIDIKTEEHTNKELLNEILNMDLEDVKDYDDITKTYRCLFINCYTFAVKNAQDIKKHYIDKHNIIIKEISIIKNKRLYLYKNLNNETLSLTAIKQESSDFFKSIEKKLELLNKIPKKSKSLKINYFNYTHYVELFPQNNISICLLETCKKTLNGMISGNIKRHYKTIHCMYIVHASRHAITVEECEKKLSLKYDESYYYPLKEFLSFNKNGNLYKCLFEKCLHYMPKELNAIKTHYLEAHEILIIKTTDNKLNKETIESNSTLTGEKHKIELATTSTNKKRRYSATSPTSNDNYTIRNECLSEDDNFTQDVPEDTETCIIKTENISIEDNDIENESENSFNSSCLPNENTQEIDVSNAKETLKEKRKFIKLCLGLILKHDLRLKLFDDALYFKPLLAPYEKSIDININAEKLEEIMLKVNCVIKEELMLGFRNKVLCLELYVLEYEINNYLIFNIRYLSEEAIHNRIIGYLPITEETTTLPISEYLNKFNISEEQIYVKTILAVTEDNAKIYKICNNLQKHNVELKNHPLQELKIILRSFKQQHLPDIENWQILTGYKTKLNFNNLQDFAKHINNLIEIDTELKPKLINAQQFFKTLQIFWNLLNKLSAEQYVVGDFYRDLLCCELELKNEQTKNNNTYAGNLNEKFLKWKETLMDTNEFLAALYLDVRFNFLGTRLINEEQKAKAKLFLSTVWDKFCSIVDCPSHTKEDPLLCDKSNDEYALLDQHFTPSTTVSIQDKLTIWVSPKREPFSLDILKFWHQNLKNMNDINELTKIAYTFSVSQYVAMNFQENFIVYRNDIDKFDKFIIKFNENLLKQQEDLLFNDLA